MSLPLVVFVVLVAVPVVLWRMSARIRALETRLREQDLADRLTRLETTVRALRTEQHAVDPRPSAAPSANERATELPPMVAGPVTEPGPRPGPLSSPEPAVQGQPAPPASPRVVRPASPPPAPAQPAAPRVTRTTPATSPVAALTRWLFGGNAVVRVGVVVLFFGVAFFLNYAIDRGWVPIELRLAGAAGSGLGLVALGWWLRARRADFGLAVQGGGVGIVYLTVFAAVNVYDRLGTGAGLGLMVGLVALASGLAVLQSAHGLAVLATLGGFLAPVLMSGGGSHVGLFAYYLVLDLGVLAIAWFRAWRLLNLLGFVFTFGIGAVWGLQYYRPEYFSTTEPFLAAFVLLYVAVPILFARRTGDPTADGPPRMGLVDGTLVFGVPLFGFGLQSGLVGNVEHGLAWSAFTAAVFYLVLGEMLRRHRSGRFGFLAEAFLALGVGFGTLTVPLALDARWTSAAWALEGAGLVWVGVRQKHALSRVAGLALQLASGAAFSQGLTLPADALPVVNAGYLGALLVSLAGLLSAWVLRRAEGWFSRLALWWGLLWWFGAGIDEIARHVPAESQIPAQLLFSAGTFGVVTLLRRRLDWRQLATPCLFLLPGMGLAAVWLLLEEVAHPLYLPAGLVGWLMAFGVHGWMLRRLGKDWPRRLADHWHTGTVGLAVFLLSYEVVWLMGQLGFDGNAWSVVSWILVPMATAAAVPRWVRRAAPGSWPFGEHGNAYTAAVLPLLALTILYVVFASVSDGDPNPLPYVPVLNPVELIQLVSLIVVGRRLAGIGTTHHSDGRVGPHGSVFVAGLGFIALNGMIARACYFYAAVPFAVGALWASTIYQMAVSITWTLAALVVMVLATWKRIRTAWMTGAVLLTAVVLKLFVVDLAGVGTIARIVSFLVVGTLILLIGYLSPLPPRRTEQPS